MDTAVSLSFTPNNGMKVFNQGNDNALIDWQEWGVGVYVYVYLCVSVCLLSLLTQFSPWIIAQGVSLDILIICEITMWKLDLK